MSTHKPDLEPAKCDELHRKIQGLKKKLDEAYKGFEEGVITAAVAADTAENYQGALREYDQHCGAKRVK